MDRKTCTSFQKKKLNNQLDLLNLTKILDF